MKELISNNPDNTSCGSGSSTCISSGGGSWLYNVVVMEVVVVL